MKPTMLQLLAELGNEVIQGNSYSKLLLIQFSEIKKIKLDGFTMIIMVSAIQKLEEKFDVDTRMLYKIPKEFDFLMENLKNQYYKKGGTERMEQYNFFKKMEENKASFEGIVVNLEDIIVLDNHSDQLQLGEFFQSLKCIFYRVIKFIKYLRCVAMTFANMMDFEAPINILMALLLIPLHKFFSNTNCTAYRRVLDYIGQDPLPEDLRTFIGEASLYIGTLKPMLTISGNSPIPSFIQLIFKVLRNPQNLYNKEDFLKDLGLASNHTGWEKLDRFLSICFPSSDEKETWCTVDLENFSNYRTQLKLALVKCHKAIRIGNYSPTEKTELTRHVKDSFDDAFKNISTWEVALKLLKLCFPKEETSISPVYSDSPSDPTPHSPTIPISYSPPLAPVAIPDNMILQPLDSNAPRYELVPVGPAPESWENDPAWNENEYSMNDTVSYEGNEYILLR